MPSTNGHGPRRAILYARVSTEEQAKSGYSLAQQMEALREYVAREGYEVLEEITDPGQSGASLERPGLDELRDIVAGGGISVVLAQDRDRFSREPAYTYLLRREFGEHGCKLKALNDRGDDSPEGQLTDGILDQIAKFERAKIAERTRRGRLRRAREGKVVPSSRPNFGFRYNSTRDNYVVDEEEMRIVERIFYMVGVERKTLRGVKRTFEREGTLSPEGKRNWTERFIRRCILDDVYRAHSFEEVEPLVSAEVAAKLDPEKSYGVWWFNRNRITYTPVAEDGPDGRRYRQRAKYAPKPACQWIAVPTPESGIPREWVDAAREVIAANKRASKNGGRFWELSGGILRCASCGWKMNTTATKDGRSSKINYYYRCAKHQRTVEGCSNRKHHRADKLEPQVWEFVSRLLKDPEQLRADLERMIELEREGMRGDPDRETKAWLEKLAEVERKRSGYIDLAADGIMNRDELRAKLAALEETRATAQRELEALQRRRERIEELERDRDVLVERYAKIAPEALDALAPEERHHVYKLLKLTVSLHADGTLELSGALGDGLDICKTGPVSKSPPAGGSGPETRRRRRPRSSRPARSPKNPGARGGS